MKVQPPKTTERILSALHVPNTNRKVPQNAVEILDDMLVFEPNTPGQPVVCLQSVQAYWVCTPAATSWNVATATNMPEEKKTSCFEPNDLKNNVVQRVSGQL